MRTARFRRLKGLVLPLRSRAAKEVMWHESHSDHLRREADYSLSFAEWRR
jgi:hypothetical protein